MEHNYYYSVAELYPIYMLTVDSYWSDSLIDISDELYDEYQEAMEKFYEVQSKIQSALKAQGDIKE